MKKEGKERKEVPFHRQLMFILHTTTATECATANDFKILERLTINEWPETKRKKWQENN